MGSAASVAATTTRNTNALRNTVRNRNRNTVRNRNRNTVRNKNRPRNTNTFSPPGQGVYTIGGHGYQTKSLPSFVVPPGCTIIALAHTSEATIVGFESLKKLCSLPLHILENPHDNIPHLIDMFGSLAFYFEGQRCPNFEYHLSNCFAGKNSNVPFGCSISGSGVLDVRKMKRSSVCKNTVLDDVVVQSETTNIPNVIADMYTNSVFPTRSTILDAFNSRIGQIFQTNVEKGFTFLNVLKRELMYTDQKTLCELFPGIYYNFVCRSIMGTDEDEEDEEEDEDEEHIGLYERYPPTNSLHTQKMKRRSISYSNRNLDPYKRELMRRHIEEAESHRKRAIQKYYNARYRTGPMRWVRMKRKNENGAEQNTSSSNEN